MRTHTNDYKNAIKKNGKQTDVKITYTIDNEDIELGKVELNSVSLHYEGNILKSVMKQLDLDSNVDIPLNTILTCQFGVKTGQTYEYINLGNFVVYSSEKQENENSYKIICYDKMLYSMKDYETLPITYPITIRNYINAIATYMGLTFANINDTFPNYDKVIDHELYLSYNDTTHTYTESMGYTFRNVLTELAQVTASTICINDDDELELRYITQTNDTIDEEFLKDINVNFGEKYGPVNSIVLSRAGDSDRIYLRDEQSVTQNGLCEIKISENQIMNFNDRDTYLPDILEQLDGLEYYLNDFSSPGITYYDLCDKYNVSIGDNTYLCVMFNDEINITSGLEELVHTDLLEESVTDYTKADKTDRKINQTYIIVDKQNQVIKSVVNQIGDRSQKQTTITQDIDGIASQVQDIPTITTENEGTGVVFLYDLANTVLIGLRIHPTNQDIIGLLASNLITVREGLKVHSKGVTLQSENDKVYYSLPDNLYYYDNDTYDEFIYDGKDERAYVIHRVAVDSLGNKSILDTPYEEEYPYQDIIVEEGNYNVFMGSYPTAYIYVKAMIKNDYTDLFATSYEVGSKITQSADQILGVVAETYETKAGAETQYSEIKQTTDEISLEVGHKVGEDEIISKINLSTEQAEISADKISLAGKTINMTSDDIAINSTNFQVDKNGIVKALSLTTGDDVYIGQNQSTSFTDAKYLYFTNDTWFRRILQQNREWLELQAKDDFRIKAQTNGSMYIGGGIIQLLTSSGTNSSGLTADESSGLRLTGKTNYINIDGSAIQMSRQPTWPSDKRLKKNIEDTNASWIDELKVKEFEYKDSEDKQIGLIAQDYIDKDYSKYFLNKNDEGYYSIAYGNITNALIQYCQEMKKEIKSLKEEIKQLKESDK